MTVTSHILETESLDEDLALLLVGDYKTGKSWLAATAPEPVLFLDFDQRAAALREKIIREKLKHIYALTFTDPTDPNMLPTAFDEMLKILMKLETDRSVHNLFPSINGDAGALQIKTVVFDSVQTISKSANRYVLYNNTDVTRSFVINKRIYRVPKTYHAWGGEMEMVLQAVLQAAAIKGLNVILNFHECMEQDERSTEENPIYTGKIELFPRRYNFMLAYFNEVWRLTRDQGRIPKISVDPDGKFSKANTALGVDKIDTPNIKLVLAQAKAKLGQK